MYPRCNVLDKPVAKTITILLLLMMLGGIFEGVVGLSEGENCNNSPVQIIIRNLNANPFQSPSFVQKSPNSPNLPQQFSNSTQEQIAFHPSMICVKLNTNVTWNNTDTSFHTISSGNFTNGPDFVFISPILSQGEVFSYNFTKQGNFTYYDPMHPDLNGTVQVLK